MKPIDLEELTRSLNEERDKLRARLVQDREELIKIEGALSRIEDGTYGHCIACNEPIDELRLVQTPDADLCVSCATLQGPDPWMPDGLYW